MDQTSQKLGLKKTWSLTQTALDKLLRWLDDGAESDGRSYLEMRARLVTFFDRKNCGNPDELADETLNRVGRRLEEEGAILTETPAKYCYTLARFVFLEDLRSQKKAAKVPLDDVSGYGQLGSDTNDDPDAAMHREKTMECLEDCVKILDDAKREVISRYYIGEKRSKIDNRRRLAEGMGLSVNALSIKAYRIREKLENCVSRCIALKERN